MISNRVRTILLLGVSVVSVGCNRDKGIPAADSSSAVPVQVPVSQPTAANTGWNDTAAGPFLLLSTGDEPINAVVVLPRQTDSTLSDVSTFQLDSLSKLPVDLLGPSGTLGESVLVVSSQKPAAGGCVAWPVARLATAPAAQWNVGFLKGKVAPVQLESVEKLSSADSSTTVIELARIASAVSVNGDAAFRGLPFTVQKAYRLSFQKTSVLVGIIARKINEEANPRQEQLLLIAESSETTGGKYVAAFQSRSAGSEDSIRTSSVLAAIQFVNEQRPALVMKFEYDEGSQVALLERVADHQWRITWRSAYTGC